MLNRLGKNSEKPQGGATPTPLYSRGLDNQRMNQRMNNE